MYASFPIPPVSEFIQIYVTFAADTTYSYACNTHTKEYTNTVFYQLLYVAA
jgi:hypothetical protein